MHVPFLASREIKKQAELFRKKYNPKLEIPVPIEDIIDFDLNINILSIPNLERDSDIDCYINSTFDTITIDQYCFDNQVKRARFSFGHELGHLILHKNIYANTNFDDINSYIAFRNKFSPKDYKSLEIQANIFSGHLLLPETPFESELKKIEKELGGLCTMSISDLPKVVTRLSTIFDYHGLPANSV